MKKLLTLVLALALVFAIAAPAMAITGDTSDPDPDPTALDLVDLEVALFSAKPAPNQFAGFNLSPIAANKAYIVNEVCYYGIAVQFTEIDFDENEPSMAKPDYWDSDLIISSDALTLEKLASGYIVDTDYDVTEIIPVAGHPNPEVVKNKITIEDVDDNLWYTGSIVYLFGQGVVKAKGVLKVELKKDFDFEAVGDVLEIYDGDENAFNVLIENTGFVVYDWENEGWVRFFTNAKKEVTKIEVSDDNVNYHEIVFTVPVSGGGSVVQGFTGVSTSTDAGKKQAAGLLEIYNSIMGFFGFNYDAEGVLLPKHFLAKATGLYLKDEVAIQLYTADIVVPGGVNPPKTGDASTVIGFVMIVLAMVAAGVVVSRKVRA